MPIPHSLAKIWPTLVLFIGFLSFSCYYHWACLSWDFSTYVLNAKYLFYDGLYFEILRPPLTSILLAPFIPLGVTGEYIYIILVSILFFYSCIHLANNAFANQDKSLCFLFCYFNLTGYVILYSFMTGSELLSLALLQLFCVKFIRKKPSAHLLALSFLARYSLLIFVPILLIDKSIKRIGINLLLFALVVSPWLVYNYLSYGNPITSFLDSYAINFTNRDYMIEPFKMTPIFQAIGWNLPFVLVGSIVAAISLLESRSVNICNKSIVLMIIVSVAVLYQFNGTPLKLTRYLFNLSLPIAFFSTLGFVTLMLKNNWVRGFHTPVFLMMFGITLVGLFHHANLNKNYDDRLYDAAQTIQNMELQNCSIVSPIWTMMHYLSENVYPLRTTIEEALESDELVLIFKGKAYQTVDDEFDTETLDQYPIIYECKEYIILGDTCKSKAVDNLPYLARFSK